MSTTPDCCDIPEPQREARFHPDEIILYGINLDSGFDAKIREGIIRFDDLNLVLRTRKLDNKTWIGPEDIAIAVIYGYAYEGQCYRMDKTKLMIFPYSEVVNPANGCGFEKPYLAWRVNTKWRILELTASIDFAEVLVLENNLPGKRPTNTYSASYQLAHRGGRLVSG